jgi:hypothetical protein
VQELPASASTLEREASARAELRLAFASAVTREDWCEEALIVGVGLGRRAAALTIIGGALAQWPDDPVLVSVRRDLARGS